MIALFLFTASCGETAPYLLAPAPALAPLPSPQAQTPALPSPHESKRKGKALATPSPTPAPVGAFYLAPFKDARRQKDLWKGKSNFDSVNVMAQGLSLEAKTWSGGDYGHVAFLWHRQLAQALAASGLSVDSAQEPGQDQAAAAEAAGASWLLQGDIKRLDIEKRGADALFGTNFEGTNYTFIVRAHVSLVDLATRKPLWDKDWDFRRVFYDPTSLGSADGATFPQFFLRGLDEATQRFSGDVELRAVAGLPPFTPTPTCTPTFEVQAPKPGSTATAVLEPTLTPAPTPDWGPYWINPKTLKKVDPKWNFDPEDGTPRKDFVMRLPAHVPQPSPTAAPSPAPSPAVTAAPAQPKTGDQ